MTDTRRVDPEARRRALVAVATATVAGLLLIMLAQWQLPALQAWLTEDLAQTSVRLKQFTVGVTVVFGVPTLVFALKFWRMGARIVEIGQLPTPEMTVIRDTRVFTGNAARWRGRLMQALAVSLVVALVVFVAILWSFAELVESRTG